MLSSKMRVRLEACTPTFLPRKSDATDLALAITSKHPVCTPVSTLIGTPASIDDQLCQHVQIEVRLATREPHRVVDAEVALHVLDR